jgi:histidinol-phosphate/aromatic aminotransferase/cobyric acid decarboxylase-like protein/CTP:molybdopterin cytidylyltransferase MocA
MKAIILAAGRGTRLGPLTDHQHKSDLTVGGVSLLERIIESLVDFEEIVVVTGYRAAEVESRLQAHPRVRVVENPHFDTTGNLHSLALAFRDILPDGPVILIESDLVYSGAVLQRLLSSPHSNVALVAPYRTGMDGTVVVLEGSQVKRFVASHQQSSEADLEGHYKTLNLYRFSASFCEKTLKPMLEVYDRELAHTPYYEVLLGIIVYLGQEVLHAEVIQDEVWAEIDDPNDLALARAKFEPGGLLKLLQADQGGLWNHSLLDFCYLRNPHFPPPALLASLRANLQHLLEHYGSSQPSLNRKLSYLLHCDEQRVTLLNGASQAFPWLSELWRGQKVLIPDPTFGEYTRWFESVTYSDRVGYRLDDVRAGLSQASVAVVVNPNNPTGTVMETQALYELCGQHPEKFFLIDESFLDFSGQPGMVELLEARLLPNVAVLKSLGKSLGIPGLRLGFLYTACPLVMNFVRQRVPIWNSNSVAEHFLELALKHREAMQASFRRVAQERSELAQALKLIPGIEDIYPSGGNFLLVRHPGPDVLRPLLDRGLLLKDASAKFGDGHFYLRIGVRSASDNQILLHQLADVLARFQAQKRSPSVKKS